MKVNSNNDLDIIESVDSSNSSADLSVNSESHDFLMVCMPIIRPPKEPDSDDVELYEDSKKTKSNAKKKVFSRKGTAKNTKSTVSLAKISLEKSAADKPEANLNLVKRAVTMAIGSGKIILQDSSMTQLKKTNLESVEPILEEEKL